MKRLKKHFKEVYPVQVDCAVCNESFTRNCELEVHIEVHHKDPKLYKCDKAFFLSWRLRKHESIHASQGVKNCHFFNNEKLCPFEKLGGMFSHKESELCKFYKTCSKTLCSYTHSKTDPTLSGPLVKDSWHPERLIGV